MIKNHLWFGDNLTVLREQIQSESVDLVYLDPPFNSNATYNILYKTPVGGDAQVKAFEDTWSWEDGASKALDDLSREDITTFNMLRALQSFLGRSDMMAYLAMMAVRLVELRRVLKSGGSIYLHCDPTACHYLKILMDAVFKGEGFINHISWKRSHAHSDGRQGAKHFGRNSDTLLFYSRSSDRVFNVQYTPYSEEYKDRDYRRVEEDGRRYRLDNIQGPGGAEKGNPSYELMGVTRYWRYSKAKMAALVDEGRIVQTRPGAVPQIKRYLDEMPGVPLQEIWTDIPIISNRSKEALGYPTQKPLALLERIIAASTNQGDVILDPFCGCGTAIHAAEKLNRIWIGIDITYLAIQVIEDRFKTWLPAASYKLNGIPADEMSARKLAAHDPYTFQQWAVGKVGGQSRGKGADGGIDGEIVFQTGTQTYGRGLVSVKAGRHVGPEMIRSLCAVVQREQADIGIFVCMDEPTRDMKSEAHGFGRITLPGGDRPRVQIVTAADLISGPNLGILTALNIVAAAQAARSVARKQPQRRPSADELRRQPELPPMPISGGKISRGQPSLPLEDPLLSHPQPGQGRRRKRN
ncbi:DNA methyltransferase [Mesorhizobium sp. M7A.F.Ce.TU.012.03.2.1]|uniref:DNA methyltransferase n=1 Tax=Mesorhizobium sp. M7A.F.Ce.TU.012.03.2.1 TaxID=2493681 RepID=UPI001FE127DE|nr:DNA methyltransferase [Mesorhizobium sp. M7A.F.Ce.TU.012.03.2.1]